MRGDGSPVPGRPDPRVFVLAGGVLGVALFPGHVTATLAGVLFGALAGTALALASALLGAGLCLLAGRLVGADPVVSLLGVRGRHWREWLTSHGFSAVLASRLAPGVPAGMVNYLAGLTGIRPRAFLAAVALGALPKTIAYVALGGALSEPLTMRGALAVALYAVAAVSGALVARPGSPVPPDASGRRSRSTRATSSLASKGPERARRSRRSRPASAHAGCYSSRLDDSRAPGSLEHLVARLAACSSRVWLAATARPSA